MNEQAKTLLVQAESGKRRCVRYALDALKLGKVIAASNGAKRTILALSLDLIAGEPARCVSVPRQLEPLETRYHLVALRFALLDVRLPMAHAAADVVADEVWIKAPFRNKGSANRRARPRMKIGHPDRAQHAG